ncbi:PP67 [Orf virus]|uniref:PP67 n=1 Tax=Orf virus TaxID=10258 RepID=F1AX76_ORFV|nr:PP67 [Orf virus]
MTASATLLRKSSVSSCGCSVTARYTVCRKVDISRKGGLSIYVCRYIFTTLTSLRKLIAHAKGSCSSSKGTVTMSRSCRKSRHFPKVLLVTKKCPSTIARMYSAAASRVPRTASTAATSAASSAGTRQCRAKNWRTISPSTTSTSCECGRAEYASESSCRMAYTRLVSLALNLR